jgi:hypothetical protein
VERKEVNIAPLVNLLTCSTSTPEIQQLCPLVTAKIKPQLAAAGITIQQNDILFSYDDPSSTSTDTGHSCTITTSTTDTRASAILSASASLDLFGNPLSEGTVIAIQPPTQLSAAVFIQETFGLTI